MVDRSAKRVFQYGATIFEYWKDENLLRSIAAINEGGKWVFLQEGPAFPFEDEDSYKARLVRDRFPKTLLLRYLQELNASLDGESESTFKHGPGSLIVKSGQLPRDLEEFCE